MAQNKVSVVIDGKEYISQEAAKASGSITKMGSKSEKAARIMKIAFASAAASVAAVVTGLTKLATKSADTADRIDKMSQKIGLSRETFQELDFVLSQTGADINNLERGVRQLTNSAREAAEGGNEYARAYEDLGVSVKKNDGTLKNQEQLLMDVFSALSVMENETERTAIASRLLGRAAVDLAPLLNAEGNEIERLSEKAHKLGLIMNDEAVDAGVKLTDTLDQMKRSLQTSIGNAIGPYMNTLSELGQKFMELSKDNGPIAKLVGVLVRMVTWSVNNIPDIGAVLGFIGDVVSITSKHAKAAMNDLWNNFQKLLDDIGILNDINAQIKMTVDVVGETYDAVRKGFQDGDWSDFWGVAGNALQEGIKIGATLFLAGKSVSTVIKAIQSSFGFSASGSLLPGAILGTLGVYLKLIQAQTEQEYNDIAMDMIGAIGAGLVAAGLTRSGTAGTWVATIAFNFEIGSSIGDRFKKVNDEVTGILQNKDIDPETMLGKTAAAAYNIGDAIEAGVKKGLGKARDLFFDWGKEGEEGAKDAWGIKSPSKVGKEIGQNINAGLAAGLKDPTYREEIMAAYDSMIEKMRNNIKIDPKAEISGIMGSGSEDKEQQSKETADISGNNNMGIPQFGAIGKVLKTVVDGVSSFTGGLLDSIESLSSFKAILSPMTEILGGVMDVLQPAIDAILKPIIGILRILGQTIGKMLMPLMDVLGKVVELLAKGFIWLYNKAMVPFGNFMIKMYTAVGNFFIKIINGIINLINKIPGVNIGKVGRLDADKYKLEKINMADAMAAGGSSSSYSGNNTGSNTSVQQMTINIFQYYNGPVIGEGGMAQVGEYVTRAIKAYTGYGGPVQIVEA